jgi:hypothetical protein
MEPDFSGWATKAGLVCSDGRTIMPDAFKNQDTVRVPLVWQHGHKDPKNVLGHAILENRKEGVYARCYFNGTPEAVHAKQLVEHGDINMLSIWANELIEKSKRVLHGVIREVSLVLSGANPGALIDHVTLRHSDGELEDLEDEAIIYTGLEFEHSDTSNDENNNDGEEDEFFASLSDEQKEAFTKIVEDSLGHDALDTDSDFFASLSDEQRAAFDRVVDGSLGHDATDVEEPTDEVTEADEFLASLTDDQKEVFTKILEDALGHDNVDVGNEDFQDIYDSLNDKQKALFDYVVGQALEDAGTDSGSLQQDNLNDSDDSDGSNDSNASTDSDESDDENTDPKGNDEMSIKHNVFEAKDEEGKPVTKTLSHDDMKGIVADATKRGSLKEAVSEYALSHGIQDIDVLFPEARNIDNTPELFSRRTEWVADLMGKVRKTPFSRVRTMSADLTTAEARAKGYIKGNLKKEEFFKVAKRITLPSTIYKKQKLDRDDMVDITDFDVVAWLKAEMRLMLDEEIARAILVGDGRAPDDEDKINEETIRPIANDHELYTVTVNVNLLDSNSNISEALDEIVMNRQYLKGSGLPTLYTTETFIAKFLLLKDTTGRKIYRNLDEVATDLRVSAIIPVEILEEYSDIVAILVNPADYTVGADQGGQVSMFDDFDIDYNQYKYLIEARMSGALTRLKSAMVVRAVAGNRVLVVPAAPAFDGHAVTITDQTGVVYKNADTDAVMNAAGSPYAVADGETLTVVAESASGYYFETSNNDEWSFLGQP